jgi:hypothetical protein
MRQLITVLAALILILGAVLWSAPAAGIEGIWLGKAEVPDVGIIELTMTLTKTETGYAGTSSDNMGMLNKDTPLAQIKLDGDKLSFQFPLADGNLITVSLKVEGDKMTGNWTHQEGDTGALSFERKK